MGPVNFPDDETRERLLSCMITSSRAFRFGADDEMASGSAAGSATFRGPAVESMQRPRARKQDWQPMGWSHAIWS